MTCSRRPMSVLVAGLLLAAALVQPAQAAGSRTESAAQARAAAEHAAAEVAALQPRVERSLHAYERALDQISGAVSRSVTAEQLADQAALAAAAERRRVGDQVRALYMSGGSIALLAGVLSAPSASDALQRVAYVQRLVATSGRSADVSTASAEAARRTAQQLEAAADHTIVTEADVTRRYEELAAALAEAGAELSRLSARARRLSAAEEAAARLRALAASAAANAAARIATAQAMPVPADFKRLYVGASRTCSGLSWTVLAAIGQVESGHGRNASTSYAGAQGPMQFLPETFAHYAVDGDGDGDTDIHDPADAIYTAAHYLCANGAGRGGASLYRAIWHYNHADWYVQLVLKLAGQLAGDNPRATLGG